MSQLNGYIAKDRLIKEKPRVINRGLSMAEGRIGGKLEGKMLAVAGFSDTPNQN
jgi:hypothetical protein